MDQEVIINGIQIWAPIFLVIKLDGNVNIAKNTEYTIMEKLTPSLSKSRSVAMLSEIALATIKIIVK